MDLLKAAAFAAAFRDHGCRPASNPAVKLKTAQAAWNWARMLSTCGCRKVLRSIFP